MTHQWIGQTPVHVVLPLSLCKTWNVDSESNDYERACSNSDDWIQPMSIGAGKGLVLGGGDPTSTTLDEHNGELRIVRWIYGESELGMISFIRNYTNVDAFGGRLEFENTESTWCIIDAAWHGCDSSNPCILFDMKIGCVIIDTLYLECGEYCAVVHHIVG